MTVRLRNWRETAGPIVALPPGEVHLWWAGCPPKAELVGEFEAFLSPDERARAERFVTAEKRIEFTQARGLLRVLLGQYLDCAPGQLRLAVGPAGKPFVQAPTAWQIEFNLSHTHGLVLLAFAWGRTVGVDVEAAVVPRDGDALAGLVFSDQERLEYARLPEAGRTLAFLRCWTAKEACLKALGRGLSLDPRQVDVAVPPPPASTARVTPAEDRASSEWRVLSFIPTPGFIASLAWPRTPADTWPPVLIGFDSLESR